MHEAHGRSVMSDLHTYQGRAAETEERDRRNRRLGTALYDLTTVMFGLVVMLLLTMGGHILWETM